MSTTEQEGGGAQQGVSREEFATLTGAVEELRGALDELREARTEPERREARADVRDAKADLAATARELGIDPKRLEKAAADAKASDERERLRSIVTELLDEELEIDAGGGSEPKGEPKGEKPPDEKPPDDSAPRHDHWSERPLSSLFGG